MTTCLVGKGRRPTAAVGVRGSNPVRCCFAVRGRRVEPPVTCDRYSPIVTARAHAGPPVPGAVRTQRGPGAQRGEGRQGPSPTGSALPLRAGQPEPVELDSDAAVRVHGDMPHGVAGDRGAGSCGCLSGPDVAPAWPQAPRGRLRAPPMVLRRRSDLRFRVVGATGFEPVTPSVSGKNQPTETGWHPAFRPRNKGFGLSGIDRTCP
jgi:hypothetical protein